MSSNNHSLKPFAFGLALGVLWGVAMLLTGILAWLTNIGAAFITPMASIYIGYKASLLGSIIGGVWGFADGFIGGLIFAWLYNCFSCCCKCPRKTAED